MSERKVLNKYYPPDFDPSKIPKLKGPKNRTYTIRIMAPFNMRCNTCGEYIYKGKKFNSRKETVMGEDYLGLYIFRFYIKCPRCVSEIAFKTDPENTDYALEAGATRNFEAMRTAEMLAVKEQKEIEDEEKNNPMKVLENRTKASQREMEMIETLEDLRELNARQAKVDYPSMIQKYRDYEEQMRKLQDEEDENLIQSMFGKSGGQTLKRLPDDDEGQSSVPNKIEKHKNATDILTSGTSTSEESKQKKESWNVSVGSLSKSKSALGMLVKKKSSNSSSASKPSNLSPINKPALSKTTEVSNSKTVETKHSDSPVSLNSDAKLTDSVKKDSKPIEKTKQAPTLVAPSGGLGLVGNYSDTDSDASS